MEAEAAATVQPGLKEILQNVENEVGFNSEVEDTSDSLATCVEVNSDKASVIGDRTEAPEQREMQDVYAVVIEGPSMNEVEDDPALKTSTEQAVAERSMERGVAEVSAPDQKVVNVIQMDVADASHTLRWAGTEES